MLFLKTQNLALTKAIDEFCCFCKEITLEQIVQIIDCNAVQCSLHSVRFGSENRLTPGDHVLKSLVAVRKKLPRYTEWTSDDDNNLLNWRHETPPRDWYVIAAQLRRTEISVIKRYKMLVEVINPLKQVELI